MQATALLSNTMDTSGLGNVLFGFGTQYYNKLGSTLQHVGASLDQIKKEFPNRIRDYRDDALQIDLGNAIANAMADEQKPLSTQLIEELAWQLDLQ
jgi:hypothetical protein